jgi:CyaY protein
MTDNEFTEQADAALTRLEAALEASDADLDFELKEGGILELEFENGTRIIVNRHGAAREIWVAAKSGGFHFRWDGAHWVNTRDGEELFAAMSRLVSAQSGEEVRLN